MVLDMMNCINNLVTGAAHCHETTGWPLNLNMVQAGRSKEQSMLACRRVTEHVLREQAEKMKFVKCTKTRRIDAKTGEARSGYLARRNLLLVVPAGLLVLLAAPRALAASTTPE